MSSTHESKNFFLQGPAGKLEAVLWTPPSVAPEMAALVCHPHPLFGGTMHNKVVFQAAKALDSLGIAVLRFNFRGAGLSEGVHDRGSGELDDVRAALKFMGAEFAGTPLLVAGFIFSPEELKSLAKPLPNGSNLRDSSPKRRVRRFDSNSRI